jgi:hypothetical protein
VLAQPPPYAPGPFCGIFGEETIESLLLDSFAELAAKATVTRWLVIGLSGPCRATGHVAAKVCGALVANGTSNVQYGPQCVNT